MDVNIKVCDRCGLKSREALPRQVLIQSPVTLHPEAVADDTPEITQSVHTLVVVDLCMFCTDLVARRIKKALVLPTTPEEELETATKKTESS